ncbi:hypothetical protein HDU88_001018 [Geranomyces variabilis]|nr:hypothetical protein HDU88_001018 [Geranomyces variabilis]
MALTFADLPLDVKHVILNMVDVPDAIALGQSRQPTRHGLRKAGVILPRDVTLRKYCLQKIDVKGRLVSVRKGKVFYAENQVCAVAFAKHNAHSSNNNSAIMAPTLADLPLNIKRRMSSWTWWTPPAPTCPKPPAHAPWGAQGWGDPSSRCGPGKESDVKGRLVSLRKGKVFYAENQVRAVAFAKHGGPAGLTEKLTERPGFAKAGAVILRATAVQTCYLLGIDLKYPHLLPQKPVLVRT